MERIRPLDTPTPGKKQVETGQHRYHAGPTPSIPNRRDPLGSTGRSPRPRLPGRALDTPRQDACLACPRGRRGLLDRSRYVTSTTVREGQRIVRVSLSFHVERRAARSALQEIAAT